jgi:hypothetical protein
MMTPSLSPVFMRVPEGAVVSSLLIGQGFKTSGILLVALGVTVTVFGLLPGANFFTKLPTLRGVVRKPLPRWSGRLWFAAGALLIYWGLTHGRP